MVDHTDAITRELLGEHLSALDALRPARNAFFYLVIVAAALHVLSWIVVRHTDVLAPLDIPVIIDADGAVAAAPSPTESDRNTARRWEQALTSSLALAGFVGRAATLVLCGIFIISLLISLSAKLGGAAALAKACVWSLAALAMLVPWLRAPDEAAALASAFYGYEELHGGTVDAAGVGGGPIAFIRFLVCPLLVGAFLAVAQLRFRDALVHVTGSPAAKLPLHEV